jgi:hypothetical protein
MPTKFRHGTTGGDGKGKEITPRNDWNDVPIEIRTGKQPVVPTVPNVNFFSGSTSEIRYFWVTVTDKNSGLSVTSDRALILTETNTKVTHFIFDMSELAKKNTVPFTTKNNDPYYGSDPYKIDLKEYLKDKTLDPSKFEICVAHAQYFLPDGRAWTQNWTHGDLHFGYNADNPNGPLTWWQNNLGANSGAVPLQTPHSSQGGLSFKPDWVGVKPSGDPDKGIPPPYPTSSGGRPTADTTGGLPKGTYGSSDPVPPRELAQGYFCGFIELLELRFSTTP